MRAGTPVSLVALFLFSGLAAPAAPVPPNDLCSGAESVPGAGPFPYFSSIVADVSNATTTGDPPAPTCSSPGASRSVWYRFTPTVTALYTISASDDTSTTVPDTVMAIYSSTAGCSGPFTQVACNDDSGSLRSAVSMTLNAGAGYFIVIWVSPFSAPLTNGRGAVQLKISKPVAPANDGCAGAETIPGSGPFPYFTSVTDNTLATSAGDPPSPTCQTLCSRSVWYKFVPSASTTYTISTCTDAATTVFDTVMAVYTSANACAGPFTPVACSDDSCGARAAITTTLSAGTTYYLVVWESGNDPFTPGETSVQLRVHGLFAPTVVTMPAAGITSTGAVLRAAVNPNGVATTAWFDWGPATNYSVSTSLQSIGSGSAVLGVNATLNGLAGQTYFFRIHATNVLGVSFGTNLSFAWNPARPRITGPAVANGLLSFQFTGAVGQAYSILSSTNLTNWSLSATAVDNGNGALSFQEAVSPTIPKKFYRVLAP